MKLSNLQKSALLIIIGCISELSPKAPTVIQTTNKVQQIEQSVEYDRVCFQKEVKITTYTTPVIKAYSYSKKGYDVDVTVNRKKIYIQYEDIKKMEMEGYVKVYLRGLDKNGHEFEDNFYLDHNRHIQPFVKNCKDGKLQDGDLASNDYPFGTIVCFDGNCHKVTDVGSGVTDFDLKVSNSDYSKKTYYKKVTIYPPKKDKV